MQFCPHCGGSLTKFRKETASTHSYDTLMNFGKYRNHTVRSLLSLDPEYLLWVYNNVDSVIFSDHLVDEISAAASVQVEAREATSWGGKFGFNSYDDPENDVPF